MSKKDSSKERTSYKSRSDDPPNINRSQLFWSGVNAVRNVQKSSQCDSYHFIASTESRRRHRDETERQVHMFLDFNDSYATNYNRKICALLVSLTLTQTASFVEYDSSTMDDISGR